MIINIFNPNQREIKGIFFKVPELAAIEVYTIKNDMSVSKPTEDLKAEKAKFKPLKIEHFCDMGESITVERECQVFVKTTLKGLSYTYFKVVRVEGRVEQNEVLFSSTVYSNNYEIDDI